MFNDLYLCIDFLVLEVLSLTCNIYYNVYSSNCKKKQIRSELIEGSRTRYRRSIMASHLRVDMLPRYFTLFDWHLVAYLHD